MPDDDSQFSEDARRKIYLEQPPGDVTTALYDSEWWQVFKDWLPASGWQTDWGTTLPQLDRLAGYLANTGDEDEARALCRELLNGEMPGAASVRSDRSNFLEEFVNGNTEFSGFQDEAVQTLSEAYWACVGSLAYEYNEFLAAVAHEKQNGQPAATG